MVCTIYASRYAGYFMSTTLENVLVNKCIRTGIAVVSKTWSRMLDHATFIRIVCKYGKGYLNPGVGFANLLRVKYVNIGYLVSRFRILRYGPTGCRSRRIIWAVKINLGFSF